MINYDDFAKMEIRIATILSAEKIEGTDRLLKLEVDLGSEKRTLVAGIAAGYQPSELPGRQVPILVNLEPRKIRGHESQGMILAADGGGGAPILLHPDRQVTPGSTVR
jgi:methionine--tRNA ligase beta chain